MNEGDKWVVDIVGGVRRGSRNNQLPPTRLNSTSPNLYSIRHCYLIFCFNSYIFRFIQIILQELAW
jgi:hypothetical protein